MQCCIEQPIIWSVKPLQRSFKNTHVLMWSFFHFYSLQSMERSRLCQNGGKRWGKTGRERMFFEWKIVQYQEFMFLCRMFPCRAAFQKGHFHQSGLHKPSQLPQNCCAEIHRQPLNTITFSNSLFSVCLYVCLEGHYHNKERTLHLIAHFHIKVKIKHDSSASLTQNVFDISVLVSFSKVK